MKCPFKGCSLSDWEKYVGENSHKFGTAVCALHGRFVVKEDPKAIEALPAVEDPKPEATETVKTT